MQHKEFLCDIVSGVAGAGGSSVFKLDNFDLNPGDKKVFPWLSAVAARFSQWRPVGMYFLYTSNSGDITATSAGVGTVVMSTDYDPKSSFPKNKAQMLSNIFAMAFKPSLSNMHNIDCNSRSRPTDQLYVRTAPRPGPGQAGNSGRLTDIGTFYIATQGCTPEQTMGTLEVVYDFELNHPELPLAANVGSPNSSYTFQFNGADGSEGPFGDSSISPTALYDNCGVVPYKGPSSWGLVVPQTLPVGYYHVHIWWNGQVSTSALSAVPYICAPVLTSGNAAWVEVVTTQGDCFPLVAGTTATKPTFMSMYAIVKVTGSASDRTLLPLVAPTGSMIIGATTYATPVVSTPCGNNSVYVNFMPIGWGGVGASDEDDIEGVWDPLGDGTVVDSTWAPDP